ncbi:ATP-dependent helicase HrpB [Paenibacillus wynnii]|uniref:ATP-dependent helicase HrpB n=1 Tax=Paenibacillus wynnii TaxID=268407 RepID=UPI0027920758|nr:ATP-dependent helicase HrpB [Paenibacillus wynnii]MDQ0195004.1 ATP-dependent helicase HrpB [Paenibacillus wynnii]
MDNLPIMQVLPELIHILRSSRAAVLIAEPGAGKTTATPPAFLNEPWLEGKTILMLEPRRLAARSAAVFMSAALGERVGQTVGYRMRMDSKVSKNTRIIVVTEGVLTRMLQSDPSLGDVGLLIFDEFHERSLHADLGLALALEAQSVLREDLRILIMSATLDGDRVSAFLGGVPVVDCPGRSYPVETIYAPTSGNLPLEKHASAAVRRALAEQSGDILLFLPGEREIRRTQRELELSILPERTVLRPLYGQLSQELQDLAVAAAIQGQRKVVLATSIAETSLTIQGVRTVIDTGLRRTQVFSPRTGMPRLETVPVSKASADQRRGRAGRTAPGVCYRLWSQEEHHRLPDDNIPEMMETDLAQLALELAVWGVRDPAALQWLDAPPAAPFAQGAALLRQLGALDARGAITPHGRSMAALGAHPRIAHMLLRALELGAAPLACRLAALLGERDPFRGPAALDCDLTLRVESLLRFEHSAADAGGVDPAALRVIQRESRNYLQQLLSVGSAAATYALSSPEHLSLPSPERQSPSSQDRHSPSPPDRHTPSQADRLSMSSPVDFSLTGLLLSFAYPDRIGQKRDEGAFVLSGGRGAAMSKGQPMERSPYIVAAAVDDRVVQGKIILAAAMEETQLLEFHAENITEATEVYWDSESSSVKARSRTMFGNLILKETSHNRPTPEETEEVLLTVIAEKGLDVLPWEKGVLQLRQRMMFMQAFRKDWPEMSDEALIGSLDTWLKPYLQSMRSMRDLNRIPLNRALEGMLDWNQRQILDKEAPTHITVPSGSRVPVDYENPEAPVLAVRLQEMFGQVDTPMLGGGRIAVVLHLLSPARRPMQVTSDLASFWRSTYFEVKKDLKGRYPKHYWPDDPLQAAPTNRTRPKK